MTDKKRTVTTNVKVVATAAGDDRVDNAIMWALVEYAQMFGHLLVTPQPAKYKTKIGGVDVEVTASWVSSDGWKSK